jgi:hypothetical protein
MLAHILQRAGVRAAGVRARLACPPLAAPAPRAAGFAGTPQPPRAPAPPPRAVSSGGSASPLQPAPVAPVAPPGDAAPAAPVAAPPPPRAERLVPRAAGDDAALPAAGGVPDDGRGRASGASAAGEALEAAVRALAAPYQAYARALESRPLLTKACTRWGAWGRKESGGRGQAGERRRPYADWWRAPRPTRRARHPALWAAPHPHPPPPSFVGFMIGDIIAQSVGHPGMPLDAARVLRLGIYGLCFDGPLGAKWCACGGGSGAEGRHTGLAGGCSAGRDRSQHQRGAAGLGPPFP